MNRGYFIKSTGTLLIVGSLHVPAMADSGYLRVIRVRQVEQADGGVSHDLQFEYDFPGLEAVWIGNVGTGAEESSAIGNVPPAGVARYTTSASYVAFRTPQDPHTRELGKLLPQRIDIYAEYARFQNLSVQSFNHLPQPQRALVLGAMKYGLGYDADAVYEFGGPLTLHDDPAAYWSGAARLFRAYAEENLRQFGAAEHDYSWIIDHGSRFYDADAISQAHYGRARIRRLSGDLQGAIKDYEAVGQIQKLRRLAHAKMPSIRQGGHRERLRETRSRSAHAQQVQANSDATFAVAATIAQMAFRKKRSLQRSGPIVNHGSPNPYRCTLDIGATYNDNASLQLATASQMSVHPGYSILNVSHFLRDSHFNDFKSESGFFAATWTKVAVDGLTGWYAWSSLLIGEGLDPSAQTPYITFNFSRRAQANTATTASSVADFIALPSSLHDAAPDFEGDVAAAVSVV